jgi:hypothetical protein
MEITMAISWGLVKDIGKIAFQALMSYLAARRDDAEREADREMILKAIRQTREQILDRLNLLEANQLRGELEGFEQIIAVLLESRRRSLSSK